MVPSFSFISILSLILLVHAQKQEPGTRRFPIALDGNELGGLTVRTPASEASITADVQAFCDQKELPTATCTKLLNAMKKQVLPADDDGDETEPEATRTAPEEPQDTAPAQQPALPRVGGSGRGIGPRWTWDPNMEKPAGKKDMGGWMSLVYTAEQQARLGVDEEGKPAEEKHVEAAEAVEDEDEDGADTAAPRVRAPAQAAASILATHDGGVAAVEQLHRRLAAADGVVRSNVDHHAGANSVWASAAGATPLAAVLRNRLAQEFTARYSGTVDRVDLRLDLRMAGTGTCEVSLHGRALPGQVDAEGRPSVRLAARTLAVSRDAAALASGPADVRFDFTYAEETADGAASLAPRIVRGRPYYVVLRGHQGADGGGDYPLWLRNTDHDTGGAAPVGTAGKAWATGNGGVAWSPAQPAGDFLVAVSVRAVAPLVHAVEPASGPVSGGTAVTVTGHGLGVDAGDLASVTLGGVNCGALEWVDQSEIRCVTEDALCAGHAFSGAPSGLGGGCPGAPSLDTAAHRAAPVDVHVVTHSSAGAGVGAALWTYANPVSAHLLAASHRVRRADALAINAAGTHAYAAQLEPNAEGGPTPADGGDGADGSGTTGARVLRFAMPGSDGAFPAVLNGDEGNAVDGYLSLTADERSVNCAAEHAASASLVLGLAGSPGKAVRVKTGPTAGHFARDAAAPFPLGFDDAVTCTVFGDHAYFGVRSSPHSSGGVDGTPAYGGGGVVRVALPSSPTDTATAFEVTGTLGFGDNAGPVVASVAAALTGPLAVRFSAAALLVATHHPPAVRVLPIGVDSGAGAGGDLALHETAGTLAVDAAPAPGDAAGFPTPVGAFARMAAVTCAGRGGGDTGGTSASSPDADGASGETAAFFFGAEPDLLVRVSLTAALGASGPLIENGYADAVRLGGRHPSAAFARCAHVLRTQGFGVDDATAANRYGLAGDADALAAGALVVDRVLVAVRDDASGASEIVAVDADAGGAMRRAGAVRSPAKDAVLVSGVGNDRSALFGTNRGRFVHYFFEED